MQTFSIRNIVLIIIFLTIGIYLLTLPFKNMTTLNGQEAISIIEEQLDKGNKVTIDNIEIKEIPKIYTGDKYSLKIENDKQGHEIYKFYIVKPSQRSNVIPFIVPMLR